MRVGFENLSGKCLCVNVSYVFPWRKTLADGTCCVGREYGMLFVLYVGVTAIRALMLAVLSPLLLRLGFVLQRDAFLCSIRGLQPALLPYICPLNDCTNTKSTSTSATTMCFRYGFGPRRSIVLVHAGLRGAVSLSLALVVDLSTDIDVQVGYVPSIASASIQLLLYCFPFSNVAH